MLSYDLLIIGGGPSGLAAAISAHEQGVEKILILEREDRLGGILNQCIHNGFGLHVFNEELTGPEYALRFIKKIHDAGIEYKLQTMVIDISEGKCVTAVNSKDGILKIQVGAVILAMGCRERPRGSLLIPGTRCSGIFTAGTAQKYVNIYGYMPGKRVVVLGSGDIGLIMARRMTLEGAEVLAVAELMPYSTGLKRNIVQCLNDYDIPLLLNHTVTNIEGSKRLEGVYISEVDEFKKPIPGTEKYYSCDTLLLSVGLIPENELSKKAGVRLSDITGGPVVNNTLETNIDGIFACGNVLHVHDLADNATLESYRAGKSAAEYIKGRRISGSSVAIKNGYGIRYVLPSAIYPDYSENSVLLQFRTDNIYKNCFLCIHSDDREIMRIKKRVLTPGEMESINISSKILKEHSPSSISISVERSI